MAIELWKILLIVVIIALYFSYSEGFENRNQKASAIYEWFKENPDGSYLKYNSDMDNRSNIVEYEDVRQLFQNRNFTLDNVKKVV
jgi:hypothetical protein